MKRVALVGPGAARLLPDLQAGGFDPEALSALDFEPERAGAFDLFVLSPFREDGLPLYDRFREMIGRRRVAIVLLLDPEGEEFPESFLAGINDVLFPSTPADVMLETFRRQISVPRRRDASTLARVRSAGGGDSPHLGTALNVSRTGVLIEVQQAFSVGDEVDLEFFLADDPEPISASATVRRATFDSERLRRNYGLSFSKMADADRERLLRFCEGS
ncbi:MAG TPA: PilZ domain-containing protein [Thermoanaerobaculia bacterium]|nr:PilZ domain-containing protein [Thermoanaerobaculia bacterium]